MYYNYHKSTTTRTKTRPDSKQEMVTWRNEVYHYTYIIHILSSNIPLLAFHKVRYHLSFWIINGIGFRYWVKEGKNSWYTYFYMIWILDHSFDGLLLHSIYIQAACIFFRYGFVSNGNNAINVEVNTSPLYIVVWSCQIFYIIKVMPFCNRTFQTYAPASSTAG